MDRLPVGSDGFGYRIGFMARCVRWSQWGDVTVVNAAKGRPVIKFTLRNPIRREFWWYLHLPAMLMLFLFCLGIDFVLVLFTDHYNGASLTEFSSNGENEIPTAFYRGTASASLSELVRALEAGPRRAVA